MNDKYVKLADVKRKLRYIFKAYGVGGFVKEKVEKTLGNLPYSVKGDLETTLEAADVQPVKHGHWSECYTDMYHYSGICSVCGKASIKNLTESLYAFCPKCGARMDGDTKCQ